MSGVFAGNQWTTASGSNWNVVIGPSFLTEVAELSGHLALASQDARTASEKIVESAEAAGDSTSAQQKVVDNLLDQIAETGVNQGAEARDIEGFANQFAGLVNLVFADEAARTDRVQRLAIAIARGSSQTTAAGSRSRYAALSALLNSLPSSAPATLRISIFSSLVQAACNRNELPIIRPALTALPRWLKDEWQLQSTSQADEVVDTVITLLEKVQAEDDIRLLLFAYVDPNSTETLKEKLLLYSLASNAQDAYEIESLPSPSQNQQLAQLRNIFLSGSLQDLQSLSAGSDLPKPLDAQKLQDKLRHIILSDFCFTRVGQTATYAEVAQAIRLDQSNDEDQQAMEVESWVIATIRAKLLTARLHQPSSTISILRASPRRFSDAHWQTLHSRLENWKNSISSIQEVVNRAVGPAPSGQRRDGREDNFNAQTVTSAARELENEAAIEVA